VHRVSPAALRFFGHRPTAVPGAAWPAPLQAVIRRLAEILDPPLHAQAQARLVQWLHTDAERVVVERWLRATPRLRRSDWRVVEAYVIDRDCSSPAVCASPGREAHRAPEDR
jgi:hypothetical protein